MINFEPLKQLLKERQLSLRDIEKETGIYHNDLSQVLNKRKLPRISLIEKLCTLLSCNIQDVIEWSEEEFEVNKDKIEFVDINWEKLCNIISTNKTSLGKVSQSLGHSYAFLSNAKQRKSKVRQGELIAICNLLNCSKEDLIN